MIFLRLVSVSSEKNLMSSGNLGVVFGPTLMKEETRFNPFLKLLFKKNPIFNH